MSFIESLFSFPTSVMSFMCGDGGGRAHMFSDLWACYHAARTPSITFTCLSAGFKRNTKLTVRCGASPGIAMKLSPRTMASAGICWLVPLQG